MSAAFAYLEVPLRLKIMIRRSSFLRFAVLVTIAIACIATSVIAQPKVSPDEQKAYDAWVTAPDAVKAQVAEEFVKKFPKSSLRPGMARKIADQIRELTDAEQRVSLAQKFKSIFNNADEEEMIMPVLIVGYADAKKPDDAYTNGTA